VHEQPRDRDRPRRHHRAPGPGEYGHPDPEGYPAGYPERHGYPEPGRPDWYREPGPGYPSPPSRPIPAEAYRALFQQAARPPRWPYALLVVGVAVVGLIAGVLIGTRAHGLPGASSPATSPAAVSSAASSAGGPATATPPTASPAVLARFSGSGARTTRRFTVPASGSWLLRWSYECASLGSQGSFMVTEDRTDMTGVTVNALGRRGHGVTRAHGDAGRHYLVVNSDCTWSMTAVAQG